MQQVHAQQQQVQVQQFVVTVAIAVSELAVILAREVFNIKTFLQAQGIISTLRRVSNCDFPGKPFCEVPDRSGCTGRPSSFSAAAERGRYKDHD
jgi:hypothetical protein